MRKRTIVTILVFLMCLVLVTGAWAGGTKDKEEPKAEPKEMPAAPPSKYHESPMLAAKVAAGELPPVEERLPLEPKVIEPLVEVGKYGGTIRAFSTNMSVEGGDMIEHIDVGNAYLLIMNRDGTIEGNLAKDYDFAEDLKTFTLYLREGAKWSDGHPFTADDILFMFDDMLFHEQITTWNMYSAVNRAIKIDDFTVRFEMDNPFPPMEIQLGAWMGSEWGIFAAKHYLEKWHIEYNPKANELAKDEGFDEWWEAFHYHWWYDPTRDIEKPTMMPWMFSQLTTTVKAFERNPYFYQVDIEGKQLPYIDRVTSTVVDAEVYQVKIMSGEADIAVWNTSVSNYPLYKENEKQGGYTVHTIPGVMSSEVSLGINQNHQDPFLRETFQDIRFRRALSVAMNRDEINESVLFGLGVPGQATALPSTRFYKKEWTTTYAQYDPDMANRLLDEAGLTDSDKDGFRLDPDGNPIIMLIEHPDWGTESMITILELVKEYWEAVGLKTAVKVIVGPRGEALDHVVIASTYADTGEVGDYMWRGRAPAGILGAAPAWSQWLTASRDIEAGRAKLADFEGGVLPGEEPPEHIKELDGLATLKIQQKFGSQEYFDVMEKIFDYNAEKLYVLGTVGSVPTILIAKSNMGNVPQDFPFDKAFFGDLYNDAAQLFYK